VGTGFKPPLKGLALAALEWVKSSGESQVRFSRSTCPPVGQRTETGATVDGPVFPADAVITFTAPKPAHVFGQLTRRWDQPVVVAPIGSPAEAIVSELKLHWAGSAMELAQTPRGAGPTRATLGMCWWWAARLNRWRQSGRSGNDGAWSAACGAGLVTGAVPAPALAVVSAVAPELMTWPLAATPAEKLRR